MILPRPRWRGFSFALHLLMVQGFYFCPVAIQLRTIRLQRVLFRKCNYTAHAIKQRTGLYRCVSGNLTHSTAYNTRPAKADITPPAPRCSTSQRRNTSSAYQIPDTTPDAVQVSATAYYNKVYKSAAVRPCYGSMPDSAAYHRPCQPGGVSPAAGAWRSARNH